MTAQLGQAYATWLVEESNSNVVRLNRSDQVEVRAALYYRDKAVFVPHLGAAVLTLEGQHPSRAYQGDRLYCDELEPYLVPLNEDSPRSMNGDPLSWSTYVVLSQPSLTEFDRIVASY